MKIRFDLDVEDLVAFARHHADHSPVVRRARLLVLVIGLAPLVALPPLLVPPEYRLLGLAAGVVTAAVVALRMPAAYARSVERQVRRQYRGGAFRDAFGPYELELTDTTLIKRTPAAESATRFGALGRVVVTDDYTFVYASPASAFVIPRHAVTAGDYDRFTEAVAERVAAARADRYD